MKKSPAILPPAVEWDFREVDPVLLAEAAQYEYFRSSDKIRELLVCWLDAPLNEKKVRQHILDAAIKRQKGAGEIWQDGLETHFPKGIQSQIFDIGQKLTPQCFYLYECIAQYRPDFPNPWTTYTVKGEWNKKFKRVHLRPMSEVFKFTLQRAEQWPKGWKDYLAESSRSFSDDKYRLDINFFADGRFSTIEEIVSDFETWLRAEVKRTNQKMRSSKDSQTQQRAYPLKCLAALRLSRAGLTYEAAAEELQKIIITKRDAWFVPFFENPKSWTKATQFAKKQLAEFEASLGINP